jgi:periplasmic protein TonB
VAAPVLSGDDKPSRWGFFAAIIVSAAAHVAFFILVLVILPGYLYSEKAPPPAYTVKIVDQLPAGDLGTHLPRLAHERRHAEEHQRPEQSQPKPPEPATPLIPPKEDKNVIALNTKPGTPTPTPTPPPPPEPTPEATATPRPKHTHPRPTPRPRPTAKPTPKVSRRSRKPKEKPTPAPEVIAKAEPTPSIKQKMQKVREQLLAEHLKEVEAKAAAERNAAKPNESEDEGPVEANVENPGKGAGVGPGAGSAGIQQDAEFLLYYQQVQEKIKKAWSFGGNNPELTATVTFGINPDGTLSSIKVSSSSRDPAFDDSVVRAIRRAAPFPPPPDKYRSQFAEGVDAVFKLAELSS